jgi:hypothetical protein
VAARPSVDALDLALQFGKDIVDGKVQGVPLQAHEESMCLTIA